MFWVDFVVVVPQIVRKLCQKSINQTKNKTGFWACNCEDFKDKEKSTQQTQYFITAAERQNVLTEPSEGSDI